MQTRIVCVMVVFLLFLSCATTAMAGRLIPSSVPSTMRPMGAEGGDFVKMRPHFNHKLPVFGGKEVKGCLPKGFRHSSAPSRFVNNEPFGSCSGVPDKKP